MIPFISISLALMATTLPAQPDVIRLPPANARPALEFSDVFSMRELRDGRVLVFDRKENWLAVVDLDRASIRHLGRPGSGPGEFQGPLALFPLGGDSTLAADLVHRWLILVGDSIVATLPPDDPAVRAVALWPLGADRRGRVLARSFGRASDSFHVSLVNRASGRIDTIATLRLGVRRARVSTVNEPGRGPAMRIGRVPLNVQETALLTLDGWTAVVRLEPYRVDWRSPEGRWSSGRPIAMREIRMDERERKAYAERNPWSRTEADWPETVPPFDSPTSMFATPDGWLAIQRLPTAGGPETRYDLIDRSGVRRAQLVLPRNQHIVGFGAVSVYVIETDDDGIQRLRRHAYSATAIRP